jgi:hypothetical protein
MADLVCVKCSGAIPGDARFCPTCGDPVTAVGRPADISPAGTEQLNLVCPKCAQQRLYAVSLTESLAAVTCSAGCNTTFQSRICTIRSKRSSQSKKNNTRTFSFRVQAFSGQEDLVDFVKRGTEDFELKTRDTAAFSYLGNELRVVQNLNLHRHMMVQPPGSCFVATHLYGPHSPEVATLREWRDRRLLSHAVGRRLVSTYYRLGPSLVVLAQRSSVALYLARATVGTALWALTRQKRRNPDPRHGR